MSSRLAAAPLKLEKWTAILKVQNSGSRPLKQRTSGKNEETLRLSTLLQIIQRNVTSAHPTMNADVCSLKSLVMDILITVGKVWEMNTAKCKGAL
jgi:hypothetical protein